MKKYIKSLIAAVVMTLGALAPLAIVIAPVVATTGCVTSKVSKAVTSIKDIEKQVVTALDSYADRSARASIALNKNPDPSGQALVALLDKDKQVDAALKTYQVEAGPMRAKLKAALANDTDPAPANVLAAGRAFISTANSLLK